MHIIGIICEYNPFHNGHLYHIQKIKEIYPQSLIIVVLSTSFCERGEVSVLNKWDKTKIALENNIDLVIELPFVFSSQSADIFSYGAAKLLNELQVDKIIFGSETNDINKLTNIANQELNNKTYQKYIKENMKKGYSYPKAIALSKEQLNIEPIDTPNDILGISYIKEIIINNYKITPITIKRTNDYHEQDPKTNITSATAIRNLINNDKDIKKYVPKNIEKYIYKNIDIFPYLKYKINSDINILNTYQTVDEGIENKLIKHINEVDNLDELIDKVKSKRFTYNKINRMFIHILTSFTKEEAKDIDIKYIRLLGFNQKGKEYLNKIKKDLNLNLITSYKNNNYKELAIEKRVTSIHSILTNDKTLNKKELEKPIYLK